LIKIRYLADSLLMQK